MSAFFSCVHSSNDKNDTNDEIGWSFTHNKNFSCPPFLRPGVVLLEFVSTRIHSFIHSFIHRARWLLFQIGVVTLNATRAIRARTEKGSNKIRTTMPLSKKKKTKKATTTTTKKNSQKGGKKGAVENSESDDDEEEEDEEEDEDESDVDGEDDDCAQAKAYVAQSNADDEEDKKAPPPLVHCTDGTALIFPRAVHRLLALLEDHQGYRPMQASYVRKHARIDLHDRRNVWFADRLRYHNRIIVHDGEAAAHGAPPSIRIQLKPPLGVTCSEDLRSLFDNLGGQADFCIRGADLQGAYRGVERDLDALIVEGSAIQVPVETQTKVVGGVFARRPVGQPASKDLRDLWHRIKVPATGAVTHHTDGRPIRDEAFLKQRQNRHRLNAQHRRQEAKRDNRSTKTHS